MTTTRIGFMFSGQGAQTVGMGADLVAASKGARELFEQADQVLSDPISRVCFDGPLAALTESRNCQPAIYAMSLAALAAFRERLPCEPIVCGGLSLGEFAAAQAAGVFSFADGLGLIAARGRLMGDACQATDGTMAAILNADPELVATTCAEHDADVANYNCPGQIVISGGRPQVEAAIAALKAAGVGKIIPLQVDGAFHSRLMQSAADQFSGVLEAAAVGVPSVPLAQNVVGGLVTDPAAIRGNLCAQITGSVRWEGCVRAMLSLGVEALVEFGPGKVLSGFMRRIDPTVPTYNVGTAEDLEKTVAELTD